MAPSDIGWGLEGGLYGNEHHSSSTPTPTPTPKSGTNHGSDSNDNSSAFFADHKALIIYLCVGYVVYILVHIFIIRCFREWYREKNFSPETWKYKSDENESEVRHRIWACSFSMLFFLSFIIWIIAVWKNHLPPKDWFFFTRRYYQSPWGSRFQKLRMFASSISKGRLMSNPSYHKLLREPARQTQESQRPSSHQPTRSSSQPYTDEKRSYSAEQSQYASNYRREQSARPSTTERRARPGVELGSSRTPNYQPRRSDHVADDVPMYKEESAMDQRWERSWSGSYDRRPDYPRRSESESTYSAPNHGRRVSQPRYADPDIPVLPNMPERTHSRSRSEDSYREMNQYNPPQEQSRSRPPQASQFKYSKGSPPASENYVERGRPRKPSWEVSGQYDFDDYTQPRRYA